MIILGVEDQCAPALICREDDDDIFVSLQTSDSCPLFLAHIWCDMVILP
jgi:hypothetical protein